MTVLPLVIDLVDHADGSSDVYIRTALSYPSVLELFAQSVISDFGGSQVSESLD